MNARVRRTLTVCLLWGLSSAVGGCKCQETTQVKPAPQHNAPSALERPDPVVPPELADIPVPTEEDFEEAAEREITIDNLEAEIDRMEKEIGQ